MLRGGLWELFGGVLAQSTPLQTYNFTRLPGVTRGIQEETWTADKLPFPIRDFGMDPAQDLWVVIEKAKQYVACVLCGFAMLTVSTDRNPECSKLLTLCTKCTSYP